MSSVISVFASAYLLVGAAVAQQNSGYLGENYSKLQDATSPSGHQAKRWLAPEMSSGKYDKVLLEKTVLFPEPDATDQVSGAVLKDVTAYLDEALRRELTGAAVQFATEPGPKTLRIKPAITAVAAKEQGLKPRELIPAALVIAAVKEVAGKRAKEARIAVEYELPDSQSNDVVGVGVREGIGKKLENRDAQLTLAHFKPVIDGWAKDARILFQSNTKK
jgi:Protein of unknown function (DUF3313)